MVIDEILDSCSDWIHYQVFVVNFLNISLFTKAVKFPRMQSRDILPPEKGKQYVVISHTK